MNTFNSAVKNKEVQCERLSSQVNYCIIFNIDIIFYLNIYRVEMHMHQLQICMIQKEVKVILYLERLLKLKQLMMELFVLVSYKE